MATQPHARPRTPLEFQPDPENAIRRDFGLDPDSVPYVVLSAITHMALLTLIMTLPDSARSLELDGHQLDDRFVQLAVTAEQTPPEKPDWLGADDPAQSTAKHAGDEGEAGDENSEETNRRLAIEGPSDNEDLELRRERNREIAMNAGIASTFTEQVSSPWGTSAQSIGSDAEHALGNLDGARAGNSRGMGGLGIRGGGRGGGGHVTGSIGLDEVGTEGMSNARNQRGGDPDLGDHDADTPGRVINHRPPTLEGALDREIIQRVVRQHRREIKACYEQELQRNQGLAGDVTVKFTISGSGQVIAALVKTSSLNNTSVEQCMTRRIRRWIFPEPTGNGIVIVKYPFRFSQG